MTRSTAEVMVDVDAALQRLVDGTRELPWDWDQRFATVVGRVSDPDHTAVLALLDQCYEHRWDHGTIANGPDVIRGISDGWGGLRPGQRLWALDPDERPLLFAAWWPWDSGKTFSLRIGGRMPSGEAQEEWASRLRSMFGA